jgi:hypothetical protein
MAITVGTYDPYLDDVSIGNDTDSEDEMKAGPLIKRKVLNPGGAHWSEEETQSYKEGWDNRDNNPDSYTYDDYGQGYVSFSTNHFAHINDKQHSVMPLTDITDIRKFSTSSVCGFDSGT